MGKQELQQIFMKRCKIQQLMDEALFDDPKGHMIAGEKLKLINQELQEEHYAEINRKLPDRERLEGRARKQLELW